MAGIIDTLSAALAKQNAEIERLRADKDWLGINDDLRAENERLRAALVAVTESKMPGQSRMIARRALDEQTGDDNG